MAHSIVTGFKRSSDGVPGQATVDDDGLLRVNVVAGGGSSSSVTSVAATASNVTLKASNVARRSLCIFNDCDKTLYVKLGATATTASYTVKVLAGGFYELQVPAYSGIVDGIWAAAPTGNALVTEIT